MISPIAIELGPLAVRWYGVFAALGTGAAFVYARFLARGNKAHIERLFAPLAALGLIGARMYHVLNELPFYLQNPTLIIAVWKGGLAIHGGLIAGTLYLFYYAKKHKASFLQLADIFLPSLLLGQAIGRWGNFFNQELFGKPTSLPWGIFINPAHRPDSYATFSYFHPTFLYESLWNIAVVTLLTIWIYKKPPRKNGTIFATALILWGLGRFFIELLRIDPVPLIFGARLPLLTSAAIMAIGVGIFTILNSKFQAPNSK